MSSLTATTSTISQNNPKKRGCFIVFEGLDRTGKTTQSQMLQEYLNKQFKTTHIRFPDRSTPVGKSINNYLTNTLELDDMAIHLMFSANRWELKSKILKYLNEGINIVCDRYCYSGVCYSAAKEKNGLDLDWCWNPEINLPSPDLVFFLDLCPEEQEKRGDYGEERYEKSEMQAKVRAQFKSLIKRDESTNWKVIDAAGSIDEIHEEIRNFASKEMKKLIVQKYLIYKINRLCCCCSRQSVKS
eukprot:UN33569